MLCNQNTIQHWEGGAQEGHFRLGCEVSQLNLIFARTVAL